MSSIRSITNNSDNPVLRHNLRFQVFKVKPLSSLSYMHLAMFSKPVCERAVYRLIRKHKFRSFIEIGLDDGNRCQNMIRIAKKYGCSPNVRYTGVDEFDARPDGQIQLSLIDMHRKLKATETKTQLVPGDVQSAIKRIANSHVRTDLIVISYGFDQTELSESWFYFPRMLHSGSLVLIQQEPGAEFQQLNRLEIEKLAGQHQPRRSIAA